MTVAGAVGRLARAEEQLGADLMLCLWGDGSGRVVDRDVNADARSSDVFLFEHTCELEIWLQAPYRVTYDATGKPVAKGAGQ
jgi:hypothetical protein